MEEKINYYVLNTLRVDAHSSSCLRPKLKMLFNALHDMVLTHYRELFG